MTTVTDVGREAVAKLINGVGSVAAFTYLARGTGSTEESTTDTALANETARVAATCSYEAGQIARWYAEVNISSAETVREIAVFNAATGGTMLLRHVYTEDQVCEAGDILQITVDLPVEEIV